MFLKTSQYLIKEKSLKVYNFIKVGLQHKYFPVNIEQFSIMLFLQDHSSGCFWRKHILIGCKSSVSTTETQLVYRTHKWKKNGYGSWHKKCLVFTSPGKKTTWMLYINHKNLLDLEPKYSNVNPSLGGEGILTQRSFPTLFIFP